MTFRSIYSSRLGLSEESKLGDKATRSGLGEGHWRKGGQVLMAPAHCWAKRAGDGGKRTMTHLQGSVKNAK